MLGAVPPRAFGAVQGVPLQAPCHHSWAICAGTCAGGAATVAHKRRDFHNDAHSRKIGQWSHFWDRTANPNCLSLLTVAIFWVRNWSHNWDLKNVSFFVSVTCCATASRAAHTAAGIHQVGWCIMKSPPSPPPRTRAKCPVRGGPSAGNFIYFKRPILGSHTDVGKSAQFVGSLRDPPQKCGIPPTCSCRCNGHYCFRHTNLSRDKNIQKERALKLELLRGF